MNRNIVKAILFTLLTGVQAFADRPEVVLGPGVGAGRTVFHQTGNRTLDNDTTYHLTGIYIVDSLETFTVEQGTVIIGDSAATLVIARGGKIFARGTASCPIVFTSDEPVGTRAAGDWGGIIMLGRAPTNQANPLIEGGIIPGTFGGGGIGLGDPDDDSGEFYYVRIEYCGYRYQLNNEVNGLTMGGVGRGTEIHHVQVSYSFDDSFEWFGGTVDCNNLVAFGGWDDEFDTDFGFQGRIQFAFGLRDPNQHEVPGVGQSNGFESDNESTSSTTNPRTLPRFSNVTLVGPRRTDASPAPPTGFEYVSVIRRGSELSLYNSVLMGYAGGYSMRDGFTFDAAVADILQGRNISLQEDGILNTLHTSGTLPGGFTLVDWWNTSGWNNLGAVTATSDRLPSTIGLVDMSDLNDPDPRPGVGSEPATAGTEFTNLNALAGGYFTSTTYRGAFDPGLSRDAQWDYGWTNYNPQNFNVNGQTSSELLDGWNLVSVDRTPSTFIGNQLYPGILSLYKYETPTGAYTNVTSSALANGEGYWARSLGASCYTIEGTSLTSVSKSTGAGGWALIGSASSPASYPGDVTVSGGTIISGPWKYTGSSYVLVTSIVPGEGYWVRVDNNVNITITP
jgi:hypothetical protein